MVTKEQCILDKILTQIGYSGSERLLQAVVNAYNTGKRYVGDMVFRNDERGLDQALEGFSPSFIVYSVIGEDSEYDPTDPLFVIDSGIRSIDEYDFRRMLKPEDMRNILSNDILSELDSYDLGEAFEEFVKNNYPDVYNNNDYDWGDLFSDEEYIDGDWNELVKRFKTIQMQRNSELNERRIPVKLTEADLKNMANSVIKEVLKRKR